MSHRFLRAVVKDVISADRRLLVMSPGLGMSGVLAPLLREYCTKHRLALVLGCPEALALEVARALQDTPIPPRALDAVGENAKCKAYKEGGVIFTGARVLAGDLLRGTAVKAHLVSALFVWKAHSLCKSEYYPCALALRVVREANPSVVVRAFTDRVEDVRRMGLAVLAQNCLCVGASLWLRGQPKVEREMLSPETLFVSPGMSRNLGRMVYLLRSIVVSLLKQLGIKCEPERAWAEDWVKKWKSDPSNSGKRTRMMPTINDLQAVISLANMVEDSLPGTFLASLRQVEASCKAESRGMWLMEEQGAQLVSLAMARCADREAPAKWLHLREILSELQPEEPGESVRVLIVTTRNDQSQEIRNMLQGHGAAMVNDSALATQQGVLATGASWRASALERVARGMTEAEMDRAGEFELDADHPEFLLQVEVEAWPWSEVKGMQLIESRRPRVIIIYEHPGVLFQNLLERWRMARHLRIYWLMVEKAPSHYRNRRSFERVREAEAELIEQVASLQQDDYFVQRPPSPFEGRRVRPKVIVDTREINESNKLVAKLWTEGWEVIPMQLGVGDYIVRDVVIERKTRGDLISSMADGRVLKQCEQMLRLYGRVAIMLECEGYFLENAFAENFHCPLAKFSLLVKSFPAISVLWAASVTDMSYMLRTLYVSSGTAELDMEKARSSTRDGVRGDELRDMTAQLFLSRIPGMKPAQVRKLIEESEGTLADLVQWSLAKFKSVLGAKQGAAVYKFLNYEPKLMLEEGEEEGNGGTRSRRKRRK